MFNGAIINLEVFIFVAFTVWC